MIEKCSTLGFMATDVIERFPQHVYDFCGLMTIDYPSLLEELQEAA